MAITYDKDLIAERDEMLSIRRTVVKWWQANYIDVRAIRMQKEYQKMYEEQMAIMNMANEQFNGETSADSNVSAEPVTEEAATSSPEDDEALRLALEISARLEAEAAEDEAAKQAEIAAAMAVADGGGAAEADDADFNAATGSYSGGYGKNVTLDESGLDQVSSILNERKDAFADLLAGTNL